MLARFEEVVENVRPCAAVSDRAQASLYLGSVAIGIGAETVTTRNK